jgi:uncharacterized membrane protein
LIYNTLKLWSHIQKFIKTINLIHLTHLKRFTYIDQIRGFAIITMLFANTAATSLAQPHPFYIRLIGSFAAPLFVFISGYTFARFSAEKYKWQTIYRTAGILIFGMMIDVFIWHILPCTTFDILYLIAASAVLNMMFVKSSKATLWFVCFAIFIFSWFLQYRYGYSEKLHEYPLMQIKNVKYLFGFWWLKALFIDGWFPLFPWLGYGVFGLLFAKLKPDVKLGKTLSGLLVFCFILGVYQIIKYPPLLEREGYSELFYPVGFPYVICSLSFITAFYFFIKNVKTEIQPLTWLGRSSLTIYVLHATMLSYFISVFFYKQNLNGFLLAFLVLSGAMGIIAFALARYKQTSSWVQLPRIVKFLLGS